MNETDEFRAWLKKNDTHLRAYTPDQIAVLAMACGFDLTVVCPNVCDRIMVIKRLLEFWESPLAEKWMRVTSYDRGMEEAA